MNVSYWSVFLIVVAVFVTFFMLYYRFAGGELQRIRRNVDALETNDATADLINGSGINNIPNLNIVTNNDVVRTAADCDVRPQYIGPTGSDDDCVRTCASDTAHVFTVGDLQDFYFDDRKLTHGAYCRLGKRPNCNPMTTRVLMTLNSVVCRSKFPELFGGPKGNDVVACNNSIISDPLNQLWDFSVNAVADPMTMTRPVRDVDELLADGTYRFRCVFNGHDAQHNKFVQHPYKRLHPIRNYCASNVRFAHESIRTVVDVENGTFTCDCGQQKTTRTKHLVPRDDSSICSDKTYSMKNLDDYRSVIKVPYRCFNIYSPITDVAKYPPCSGESFTENSQMGRVALTYSKHHNVPIEHPFFDQFPEKSKNMIRLVRETRIVD